MPRTYGVYDTDAWPFAYVVAGLRYFALSPAQVTRYVPDDTYSPTVFHGRNGDFEELSPVVAVTLICQECVEAGISWDEWIEDPDFENRGIGMLFRELVGEIESVLDSLEAQSNIADEPWSSCRRRAVDILTVLELYEPNREPEYFATTLLNEWSYGAYGENVVKDT